MQKVYNLKPLKAYYVFFTHFFESVAELVLGDIYDFKLDDLLTFGLTTPEFFRNICNK